MKLVFPAFFLAVFLLGGMALRAEDWTTIDGKVYPQIKLIKVEPDAVTILYRDGGALIPLIMLPDDLQKRFHYDASTAKAAADARDKADFENARALHAESLQIMAQKQELLKTQDSSADMTKTDDSPLSPPADPSHHSLGELAAVTRSLAASCDDQHYSIGGFVAQSSSLTPPADSPHYSMSSLFGSGDPLSQ